MSQFRLVLIISRTSRLTLSLGSEQHGAQFRGNSVTADVRRLGREVIHTVWDRDLSPALRIEPGETIEFETLDASFGHAARRVAEGGQPIAPDLAEVITRGRYDARPYGALRGHPLTGPVHVEGTRPGDVLAIEILDVRPAAWGWTSCRPHGIGLLDAELAEAGRLTEQQWRYWDLRSGTHGTFLPGIRVPLAPFCGVMGVALAEPGAHSTSPPRHVGGNLDVRQLVSGSTLFLPVEVEGALFSVGDVHGAQGDGELCGTGIETEATVTLRFGLRRGRSITTPELLTPGPLTPPLPGGWFATTGNAPDLMEAARIALRAMLAYLERERGLDIVDAYVLASACVDLKISQIVDAPNWTVSAFLPLGVFVD